MSDEELFAPAPSADQRAAGDRGAEEVLAITGALIQRWGLTAVQTAVQIHTVRAIRRGDALT